MPGDPARRAPAGRRGEPERLEAFSDGVMAVIITIMALELRAPDGAHLRDVGHSLPGLFAYMVSFAFVGIYWNNHHHLLRTTTRIDGAVMWANLHLLFWLSLVPVLTEWVGHQYRAHLPASVYGGVFLLSAVAYTILVRAIVRADGESSAVARAIGNDLKGRLSIGLYLLGILLAWITPWVSYALYLAVSVIWFVPDRRMDAVDARYD